MTVSRDESWLTDLVSSVPEAGGTADVCRLDAAVLERLASALDVDGTEIAITMGGLLSALGHDVPPFQIRTNAWHVDLPAALLRTAVIGTVSATVLQLAGVTTVPAALLGLIAPLMFDLRRVEVSASDMAVHAQLRHELGGDPRHIKELHDALPATIRAELSLIEFIEVADRLVCARLAVVGPEGIRLRARKTGRGFRLVLASPGLPADLLVVTGFGDRMPTEPVELSAQATPGIEPGDVSVRLKPRVFVSYAHESADHKRAVGRFVEFLQKHGADVVLDQQVPPPRQDWDLWASRGIRKADYVIVIASPKCRAVGDGDIEPGENRGLQAEMRILRELYASDHPMWLRKVLPVVLPGGSVGDIPLFLQPRNADHYRVLSLDEGGAEDLLRVLTPR